MTRYRAWRHIARRILQELAALPASGFPWSVSGHDVPPAADSIRRAGLAARLRRYPLPARPVAMAIMACGWPLSARRSARQVVRSLDLSAFPGRTSAALVDSAWRAALRYNVPPLAYLAFRMEEAEDPPLAWLSTHDFVAANAGLTGPGTRALARDKEEFRQAMEAAGLPVVPTLWRFEPDGPAGDAPPPPAAGCGVVVKPARSSNAEGLEVWEPAGGGPWHRLDGVGAGESGPDQLNWTGLVDRWSRRARREGRVLLLQPRLTTHPSLASLCSGGTPSCRMITGCWPDGRVELAEAFFARPAGERFASNFGERRLIDLERGRIRGPQPGQRRPVFKDSIAPAELEGVAIPDWENACRTALAAHRALPDRAVLVGWDVVPTAGGPCLVEANIGLSIFTLQLDTLVPGGRTRVAEILAAWL